MIHGLKHFQQYFSDFTDQFVLVGGVASNLLLENIAAPKVRATKDLDLVLLANLSLDFLNAFKQYIQDAQYQIQTDPKQTPRFYRFLKPIKKEYPVMVELFASNTEGLELFEDQHILPIGKEDGIESLSAILLDTDYFKLIKDNLIEQDKTPIIGPFALIPFKAKAYLEIKARGEDQKKWKKHRGDIINITVNLLDGETTYRLQGNVLEDFKVFLTELELEINPEIVVGSSNQRIDSKSILDTLKHVFLDTSRA